MRKVRCDYINPSSRYVTILIFSFTCLLCKAQTVIDPNTIVPPSPSTEGLGKYGNLTPTLSTGNLNIPVELYNLKDGDLEIPIFLSYALSGFKVGQKASRIGLGWSLHAGGVITRTLRGGHADDFHADVVLDPPAHECLSGKLGQFQGFQLLDFDQEFDVFHYNFGSYSGSFMVLDTNVVLQTPKTNLDIEVFWKKNFNIPICGEYKTISYFVVKTPDGIQYEFKNKERSGFNSTDNIFDFFDYEGYTSAWFLTKISHPYAGEIILTYDSYPVDDSISVPDQYSRVFHNSSSAPSGYCGCEFNENDINYLFSYHSPVWIDSIISQNYTITFDGPIRSDWPGDQCIDNIKIYYHNNLIKEIGLKQSYFTHGSGVNSDEKWLRLDKIVNRAVNNGDSIIMYTFNYNDSIDFPSGLSNQIDAWGYYNGNRAPGIAVETGIKYQRPQIYFYPQDTFGHAFDFYPRQNSNSPVTLVYTGYDKRSSLQHMKLGTLKKLTYPTGASISFEYEMHEFQFNNEIYSGGGLRLKEQTRFPLEGPPKIITYDYLLADQQTTSGTTNDMPQLAYMCNEPNDNLSYCLNLNFTKTIDNTGIDINHYLHYAADDYSSAQFDSIKITTNGVSHVDYFKSGVFLICEGPNCITSNNVDYEIFFGGGTSISGSFNLPSSTININDCTTNGTFIVPDQLSLFDVIRNTPTAIALGSDMDQPIIYSRVVEKEQGFGATIYEFSNFQSNPDFPPEITIQRDGTCFDDYFYQGKYDRKPNPPKHNRSHERNKLLAKIEINENGDTVSVDQFHYKHVVLDSTIINQASFFSGNENSGSHIIVRGKGSKSSVVSYADTVSSRVDNVETIETIDYEIYSPSTTSSKFFVESKSITNSDGTNYKTKYSYNHDYPNISIRNRLLELNIVNQP